MSILVLCLCLRLLNGLLIRTAFAPDEYWQGPEVAHRMVFGWVCCPQLCRLALLLASMAASPARLLTAAGMATSLGNGLLAYAAMRTLRCTQPCSGCCGSLARIPLGPLPKDRN